MNPKMKDAREDISRFDKSFQVASPSNPIASSKSHPLNPILNSSTSFAFPRVMTDILTPCNLPPNTSSFSKSGDFNKYFNGQQEFCFFHKFSLASIMAAWCLQVLGAMVCFVLAEIFQERFEDFLFIIITLGCHLSALGTIFVYFFAHQYYGLKQYRFYQPFRGGQRFVVMQFFGYSCVTLSILCAIIYTIVLRTSAFGGEVVYGIYSIVAVLSVLGNILIYISPRYFHSSSDDPNEKDGVSVAKEGAIAFRKNPFTAAGLLQFLCTSPNSESALVIIFAAGQFCVSGVALLVPQITAILCTQLFLMQLCSGFIIHYFIGYKHSPGYHFFMLLLQRPVDTLVYWAVWLIYFFSLAVSGLTSTVFTTAVLRPFTLVGVVALNAFSSVVLLLFVRTTSFRTAHLSLPSTIFEYGGIAVSIAAILLGIFNTAVSLYLSLHETHLQATAEGRRLQSLLWTFLQLTLPFFFILSPMVQLVGRVIHGENFSIFQPYNDHPSFLLIQSGGWLLYLLSLIGFALFLSSNLLFFSVCASTGCALSTMCIAFSIREYSAMQAKGRRAEMDKKKSEEEAVVGRPTESTPGSVFMSEGEVAPKTAGGTTLCMPSLTTCAGGMNEENEDIDPPTLELAYILNGELMVAYVCGFINLTLRCIIEFSFHSSWEGAGIPRLKVLAVAFLHSLVTVPLAHFSGRDKGIYVLRPFSGHGPYITLQVMGWSLYFYSLICDFLLMKIGMGSGLSMQLPYTLLGLLQLIPLILITFSISVESRQIARRRGQHQIMIVKLRILRNFLRTVAAGIEKQEERAVLQECFCAVARPALQFYEATPLDSALSLFPSARHLDPDNSNYKDLGQTAGACGRRSQEELSFLGDMNHKPPTSSALSTPEKRRQHEDIGVIVILLSVASATFYVVASFQTIHDVLPQACAVFGLIICTASCVGIHAGYGLVLHGFSRHYNVFMPFKGGSAFVKYQFGAWFCFTVVFFITLVSTVEFRSMNKGFMLIAAVFSIASQILMLKSIPKFVADAKRSSFLEQNGEALLALFTFQCSFVLGDFYSYLRSFFYGKKTEFRLAGYNSVSNVPFYLTVISISVAVPLVLVSLGRATRRSQHVMHRVHSQKNKNERSKGPQNASHTSLKTICLLGIQNLLEITTLLIGTTAPFFAFVLFYYVSRSYTAPVFSLVRYYLPTTLLLVLSFIILVVLHFLDVGVPDMLLQLRYTFVTWSLYSLPFMSGFVFLLPGFAFQRLSTCFGTIVTTIVTILGFNEQVIWLLRKSVYVVIGYRTYMEVNSYLNGNQELAVLLWWPAVHAFLVYLMDILIISFWLWYLSSYDGKPYLTGARRNPAFIEFMRRNVFADVAKYFSFKVILDDPSVQMRDDSTQYLFSFHPHGVLPGTAVFFSHTEEWINKIGENPKRYISTHVASVIFNVPLIREFNLMMNSLSVSRNCIEASLNRGNSVLIVTGGQSEMLHTAISDKTMTLVTQHRGFIRLAINHGVPLVPLISFGENNIMDFLRFPRCQRWSIKILSYPFPIVAYGRFFLPLPRRRELKMVVGKPIPIPEGSDAQNAEHVKQLSKIYFKELKELFYRHRAQAGYPEMELIYVDANE